MKSKAITGIVLMMLLVGMLTLAFNIQPVKAGGTIYIRADGRIEPPTANITTTDNITYTLTGNIFNDTIRIERNNIVLDGAGYTVQGTQSDIGITSSMRNNVTIKNVEIKAVGTGVIINGSSFNTVSGNKITNNNYWGISLSVSSNNIISGNNIANNYRGIFIWVWPSNNIIYHNNLINNTQQVYIETSGYANFWDNGYPSGGNYWSDYTGVDLYSGPYQNLTGSDDIGDTPYVINENNTDNYPLMGPWTVEGKNVTVTPSSDVGITFENVTSGGITTFNTTLLGPEPPWGFQLSTKPPTYYNIETTANYSGTIKICIPYNDTGLTEEEENALQLMQWNEALQEWMNITTYVDTENNIIYGETSHLSEFAMMLPIIPVGGISIPVNKLELLAPYIGLTILLAVAVITVAYVKKRKRNRG